MLIFVPKLIQKFSSASARTVLLLGFGGLWQCWKFLSSILQLRSLHSSPFLSMTGDIFLKQVPCPLPARLDLELWWPVFSERSIGGVGRWANCTETCTETKFQVFCSRALLTNPKPPHLLPFPPAFLPLVQGMIAERGSSCGLKSLSGSGLSCSDSEVNLAKQNWRMALAQGTAQA